MTFLRIAFKNLLRHRIRSLLTLAGIATSVAVLFSIISFNRGFEKGLSREIERTGIHFMVVPSGCAHEVASLVLHGAVIPKFLSLEVMEKIRGISGIDLVSPVLVSQLPNPERDRVDLIYGMDMSQIKKLKPAWNIKGAIPAQDDELIVGSEIAGHDKIKIGDVINYSRAQRSFRVSGILEKTGGQDDAFIYMPIKAAQEIFKKPQGATAIGVKVLDPEQLVRITEELSQKVPGIQIVTMGQVISSLSNLANSAKALSLSFAAIAVLISAAGVMNSVLMAIFERTQEIGMMRAIGASRLDVFRIIIKETVLLTTTGGIAGIVAANAGSGIIELFVRRSMPYVPSGSMITFEPWLAAACIIFSVLIGIVSGLYPAWKASRIAPVEAIKG